MNRFAASTLRASSPPRSPAKRTGTISKAVRHRRHGRSRRRRNHGEAATFAVSAYGGRIGVRMTAPSVRSCFSRSTTHDREEADDRDLAQQDGKSSDRTPHGDIDGARPARSNRREPRHPETMPYLKDRLQEQGVRPERITYSCLPVVSTKTSSSVASRLWMVSTWRLRNRA